MKFKKHMITFATSMAILFTTAIPTIAHPGRTDSSGGHYVRTAGWGYAVGSYHYHNGGSTSSSKAKTSSTKASSSTSTEYSKSLIVKIQNRLNELGYNAGKADGVLGPKTRQAIKNFQKAKKLTADGIPGPITQNALFK